MDSRLMRADFRRIRDAVCVGRGLAALCAVVCSSLVFSASGWGAYTHPLVRKFGDFETVAGVAVDSSTGDVYVYDGRKGQVLKFNASGEPKSFSSTGTNAIAGVDVTDDLNTYGEIAVDNSSGPAKGDIYVGTVGDPYVENLVRFSGHAIGIYSTTGEKLGELDEVTGRSLGPCGVTVDSNGNVYSGASSYIAKYAPKANPVTNADLVESAESEYACQVAADSSGNAFWIGWGRHPAMRLEAGRFASGTGASSVVDQNASTSLAVDPSNDELYVDEEDRVAQFGAHGEPFEMPVSLFGDTGSGAISKSLGVAVSDFNHDIYVSNGVGISVFGPLGLVPTVETGAASNVESHRATVSGTVDPEGLPVTECKVEYGVTAAYGQTQSCTESPEQIGSGAGNVEVHANLAGLTPGTYYQYRMVVSNVNGRGEGANQAVGTPEAPAVTDESFSELYETEVNVRARIDPEFRSTAYHVEYGTSEAYGLSTPESQSVGADNNTHAVIVHLAGLEPGTTYHFRFVATNSIGATDGADVKLTTFAASSTGEGGLVQPPPGGECVAGECFVPSSSTTTTTTTSGAASSVGVVKRLTAKPLPKRLTRAQKLRRALKACRRKKGRARRRCRARARKRYGTHRR